MGEADLIERSADDSSAIDLRTVEAPLLLCTSDGTLLSATPSAAALLELGVKGEPIRALPPDLWRLLERVPIGDSVEWRPPATPYIVLGCTRYPTGQGSYLMLVREVSAGHVALSERLHRQGVDSTERLVASIAHDIRSSVASVMYSAGFLEVSGAGIEPMALSETVKDISKASATLQFTVDALLDYAHLGPNVSVPVPLREVFNRALSSLRFPYHDNGHRLRMDVAPRAQWVRGNPLVVEQIFVNLFLNAVEASTTPRCVIVTAFPVLPPRRPRTDSSFYVCARVWDDGPGIPEDLRRYVFDPFFSTKFGGIGLGLAIAKQAAESLHGSLELTDEDTGTCFSVLLPSCEKPE